MKIAVLCASGKAGKLIVEEAINKGLEVSAFVRDSNKARFDSKVCVVQKDIFTLESSDLQGFDVIIDPLVSGKILAYTKPIWSIWCRFYRAIVRNS